MLFLVSDPLSLLAEWHWASADDLPAISPIQFTQVLPTHAFIRHDHTNRQEQANPHLSYTGGTLREIQLVLVITTAISGISVRRWCARVEPNTNIDSRQPIRAVSAWQRAKFILRPRVFRVEKTLRTSSTTGNFPPSGKRLMTKFGKHEEPTLTGHWGLKGRLRPEDDIQYRRIAVSPFIIGRQADVSLCLPFNTVSGQHAEIVIDPDQLILRDLGSTNGTYVNGAPVCSDVVLREGDLIQFADIAFRICQETVDLQRHATVSSTGVCDLAFSLMQFDRLMEREAVIPYFQPLVTLPTRKTIGYEVLGRSNLYGLETPKDMFLAASQLNLEAELSRLFRMHGIANSRGFPETLNLFVNTHPIEVVDSGLLESLRELRQLFPKPLITLEIHESAVTDQKQMAELRVALDVLNMQLAYDDFGAGQSRLSELVTVRPDYLKFDMHMIRNIDKAPAPNQRMLKGLVDIALDLEIVPLAEGIETEGEHETCCQIGFQMAQGYFYGRPVSARSVEQESWNQILV